MIKTYLLYSALVFTTLVTSNLRGWVSFNLWGQTEKLKPGVQHK